MQLPDQRMVPVSRGPFDSMEWKLMIHCFFDDSGKESDQGNKFVCIAGYMAVGDALWFQVNQSWWHQLLRHGLSWLHMKDFMQGQGEYESLGWDWPKKKSVLEDFITIIKTAQLIGFGVALDADYWRTIPKEITQVEGNAQQFCFMRIMRMVSDRMTISRPEDWIALYYDCDEGFTPSRFQKFIGLKKRRPEVDRYFRSFTIADPRVYAPLQAADLLAWETRKDLIRKVGGFESRPEYNFIFQALPDETLDYQSEFWTASEIEEKIVKPWIAAKEAGKEWNANEH